MKRALLCNALPVSLAMPAARGYDSETNSRS
jgi:hypothetical protein